MTATSVRNKKKRSASDTDYKICFSTDHGRRVLEDIFGFCGFQKEVFNQNPYQSAFNNGKQCVANEINKRMNDKPKD